MRVLIVGSSMPGALEGFYLKGMSMCSQIEHMELLSTDCVTQNRSVFVRAFRRFSPNYYPGLQSFNKELLALIKRSKWDVLLVFKGMELFPKTLLEIKNMGVMLVNYNPDNPYIYSGRGSGNFNMNRSLPLYDLYFTYDRNVQAQLQAHGIHSALIPFGFVNSATFNRTPEEEILRACFIGNADDERAAFLKEFSMSVDLDIYGTGWDSYDFSQKTRLHPPAYESELYATLRKYRVQLNLMRPHNRDSHNMRSFDIVGSGSIGLMPTTRDHRDYFDEGTSVFLFNSVSEAIRHATNLINLSVDDANRVRRSARSLAGQHDYDSRASQLVAELTRTKKLQRI